MNRLEFQAMAEERIVDAKVLLAGGQWSAAYYLAGYAVECGLKACIVKRVTAAAGVIFEDRRFSDKCWTHSLDKLLEVAGLEAAWNSDTAANPAFDGNWTIVQEWSEQARYKTTAQNDSQNLLDAIIDPANGVMQWIRVRW